MKQAISHQLSAIRKKNFHNSLFMVPNSVKPKGFTLIELLVVIAVIGILAGLILLSFRNSQVQAKDTQRKADIIQYQTALANYALSHGSMYPSYPGGIVASELCTVLGISSCPEDPDHEGTGRSYWYVAVGGTLGTATAASYTISAYLQSSKNYFQANSSGSTEIVDELLITPAPSSIPSPGACSGCWNGTVCESGGSGDYCGTGGSQCVNCTLQNKFCCLDKVCKECCMDANCPPGKSCEAGVCVSPTPSPVSTPTCSGCWSAGVCESGGSGESCGSGGIQCINCYSQGKYCCLGTCKGCCVDANCPPGKSCVAGTCQ